MISSSGSVCLSLARALRSCDAAVFPARQTLCSPPLHHLTARASFKQSDNLYVVAFISGRQCPKHARPHTTHNRPPHPAQPKATACVCAPAQIVGARWQTFPRTLLSVSSVCVVVAGRGETCSRRHKTQPSPPTPQKTHSRLPWHEQRAGGQGVGVRGMPEPDGVRHGAQGPRPWCVFLAAAADGGDERARGGRRRAVECDNRGKAAARSNRTPVYS